LARLHYGWLPSVLLRAMSHEFDSLSKVPNLLAPVLYIHGDVDSIVPMEMGERLYGTSADPKQWYPIRGAGHNDTLIVGGDEYFQTLSEFVKEYVATID